MSSVKAIRNLLQGVEYRNQPEVLMDYMIEDDSISDGAYRLFQLIYKDGYFDELFSIAKSKKKLANKLNTSVSSINRRLQELEKAGYINIVQQKSNRECLPSRISVDFPQVLVQALEDAPTRRQAIDRCGTVAKETVAEEIITKNIGGTVTGGRGVHSSVRSTPYIYNINKNNNTELDDDGCEINSTLDHNSSVVVDSLSSNLSSKCLNSFDPKSEIVISNSSSSVKDNAEVSQLDLIANKSRIKVLDGDLKPFRVKRQKILKLKDNIGAMKMFRELDKFNKANYSMFQKELEISELKCANEKILLDALQSGVANEKELRQQKVRLVQARLQVLDSKIGCLKTDSTTYLADKNKIESQSIALKQEIERLKKVGHCAEKSKALDNYTYLNGRGDRQVPKALKKDVLSKIAETGITSEDEQYKIADEMAYSVRFGSLKTCKITKEIITVKHGFNIALKLLREGDWERPTEIVTTRPQPPFWDQAKFENAGIDLTGAIKSVN